MSLSERDAVFAALADENRRVLLEKLRRNNGQTLSRLCDGLPISRQAVTKHLRVLERAGLIERGRQAQWRPRRLTAGPLRDVAEWVGQYRPHWEERFERLDAFLRDIQDHPPQAQETDDDRDKD